MQVLDLTIAALEAAKVAMVAEKAAAKAAKVALAAKAALRVARAERSMADACGWYARASERAEGQRRRATDAHAAALRRWVKETLEVEGALCTPEWAEVGRLRREASRAAELAERLERVALVALGQLGRHEARAILAQALRRRPLGESPLRDRLSGAETAVLTRARGEESRHAANRQRQEAGREAGWAGGSHRPTVITRL